MTPAVAEAMERIEQFAASLERSPRSLMVYEGDAIAERLRLLLSHISSLEGENKALGDKFDACRGGFMNFRAAAKSEISALQSTLSSLREAVGGLVEAGKALDRVSHDIDVTHADDAVCCIVFTLGRGAEAFATAGDFRALSSAISALDRLNDRSEA